MILQSWGLRLPEAIDPETEDYRNPHFRRSVTTCQLMKREFYMTDTIVSFMKGQRKGQAKRQSSVAHVDAICQVKPAQLPTIRMVLHLTTDDIPEIQMKYRKHRCNSVSPIASSHPTSPFGPCLGSSKRIVTFTFPRRLSINTWVWPISPYSSIKATRSHSSFFHWALLISTMALSSSGLWH